MNQPAPSAQPLGVWDMASLIVGIVVGTAIFEAPTTVFGQFNSPWASLAVWVLGGLLAFCGALCYSELGATYPEFGAEYAYLGQAYGKRIAFLFAWMQMCVVTPCSLGAMSFVFVDYFGQLVPVPGWSRAFVAIVAVGVLLALQLAGLRTGKFVQNLLTASKLLALGGLLIAGFSRTPHADAFSSVPVTGDSNPALAFILVMFAYAGWNDATSVAPEVRNTQRNLPLALLYGLGGVLLLYAAINLAYLNALGLSGVRLEQAPAAAIVRQTLGQKSGWMMSVAICVSSLGAIHGTLFAGSRMLAAVGTDFPQLSVWRKWNARGAPAWALLTLYGVSVLLTLLAGTRGGLWLLQRAASPLGLSGNFSGSDGFRHLVASAAPVFFFFFALTGLGLIVLRFSDPQRPRPFRVPGYPFTPLALVGVAAFMCYSGVMYAGLLLLLSLPTLLVGCVLACVLRRPTPAEA